MNRSLLRTLWLPAAAAVLFGVLTWPVWRWLWSEWMANDYYSHGLLIVPVSLFSGGAALSQRRAALL
jgi:hypothetical protein